MSSFNSTMERRIHFDGDEHFAFENTTPEEVLREIGKDSDTPILLTSNLDEANSTFLNTNQNRRLNNANRFISITFETEG